MVSHVLVPIDGSPLSERALEIALAENPGTKITALHVIDPAAPGYSYYPFDSSMELDAEPRHGSDEWYERAESYAEDLFEDARATADEHDADLSTELVVGPPARASSTTRPTRASTTSSLAATVATRTRGSCSAASPRRPPSARRCA